MPMKNDHPTISVVISTYNGAQWLPEQLASIEEQVNLPLEVVVRDDGSTDETPLILRRFKDRAPFEVKLLLDEANVGYAASFWRASSAASGDYIAFCDQDDLWYRNRLEVIAAHCARYQPSGVLHGWTVFDEAEGAMTPTRVFRRRRLTRPCEFHFMFVHRGCAMVVRRSVLAPVLTRSLPQEFGRQKLLSHDGFASKLLNAAGRVLCLPDALIYYRRHLANTTNYSHPDNFLTSLGERVSRHMGSDDYANAAAMYDYYKSVFDGYELESPAQGPVAMLAQTCARLSEIYRRRSQMLATPHIVARAKHIAHLVSTGSYRSYAQGGIAGAALAHDLLQLVSTNSYRQIAN